MEIKHLTDIILNQSTKYNNREAVRYKRDNTYASISWNEFKTQIECVSKYLLSQGLSTDDKVGIYSQNHPEWTICDFGTLGIRGVVVPIYPTAAYYQLEYIAKE
ncbi:MAG: AMP-binding protein, partial [Bacteroidales bacterium]|nr:AMP-binding protein [Bacteroidales bacterium]